MPIKNRAFPIRNRFLPPALPFHQIENGSRLAKGKAMSSLNEELVVKELQELRSLECELQAKWSGLKRAGNGVRASFVSSLGELQTRTQRLEQLLESCQQQVA